MASNNAVNDPGAHKPLAGQVALVTGASRGIGKGCALQLAQAGASVALVYRTHKAEAEQLAASISAAGGQCIVVQGDVTSRADVTGAFDATEKALGPVDIVVANAGSSIRRPILETSDEDMLFTLDVLVLGAFRTLQEGARRMMEAGRAGRMVVIGSVHGFIPYPNAIAYNVGKAALHHMAVSMAAELLPHQIRVNVLVPGLTDTPGERSFRTEGELQEAASQLPLGRLQTTEEVGRMVTFLVSPENNYMTGSIVTADGGISVNQTHGLRSQPGGRRE